jgi:UDPglucose 6-dehydrogenase
MRIAVVGTGYVGLVSACCFAELGHTVIGVDIDKAKVARLARGENVIYEPGLDELLKKNLAEGRLSFTDDLPSALPGCRVVFSAVATPPGEGYKADLRAVFAVAESVARHADADVVFVNKSTVPVGTGKECEARMKGILKERGVSHALPVVSNPEFLREGLAVTDTMMPERIVVGVNGSTGLTTGGSAWAKEMMEELYRPLTRIGRPLVFMGRESAEVVKYAANAFLATKISFINMLSVFAEKTGANIRDIAVGVGLDGRIGPRFLHAGIGYGGSCFPKDVRALLATAAELGVPMPIVEATDAVNVAQRRRFIDRVLASTPPKARIGVWGLSFKPKTDDMRDAPSLDIIPALLEEGMAVRVYDPVAMDRAKPLLPAAVEYASSPLDAAAGADVLLLLTEWDIFRGQDFKEVAGVMNGKHLFDGRNIYEPSEVREGGLVYHGIGVEGDAMTG